MMNTLVPLLWSLLLCAVLIVFMLLPAFVAAHGEQAVDAITRTFLKVKNVFVLRKNQQ